ncbi:MAG TPA: hypothetical protein DCY35_10495 [Prolixibacteraceae bacterium]|nr:hypothetical protein [Prolixibacteraceae bacterium]
MTFNDQSRDNLRKIRKKVNSDYVWNGIQLYWYCTGGKASPEMSDGSVFSKRKPVDVQTK